MAKSVCTEKCWGASSDAIIEIDVPNFSRIHGAEPPAEVVLTCATYRWGPTARGIPFSMCRTSEDGGSSAGSRSNSDSSDHSEVLPQAIPCFDKASPVFTYNEAGWWSPPRTSRGAVVALVCALSAAISLSLCGGCFGGLLCWTDSSQGGGKKQSDGSKLLKMSDGAHEEVSMYIQDSRVAAWVCYQAHLAVKVIGETCTWSCGFVCLSPPYISRPRLLLGAAKC